MIDLGRSFRHPGVIGFVHITIHIHGVYDGAICLSELFHHYLLRMAGLATAPDSSPIIMISFSRVLLDTLSDSSVDQDGFVSPVLKNRETQRSTLPLENWDTLTPISIRTRQQTQEKKLIVMIKSYSPATIDR